MTRVHASLASTVARRIAAIAEQQGASAGAAASVAARNVEPGVASPGREYVSRELVRQWQPPGPSPGAAAAAAAAESSAVTAAAMNHRAAVMAARAAEPQSPQQVNKFVSRTPSPWLALGAAGLSLGVGAFSYHLLTQPPAAAAAASRAACAAAATLGGLGVAAGAFGFHGLRPYLLRRRAVHNSTANELVRFWAISTSYQVAHCSAALVAAPALLAQAGFVTGIVLFSGSLQCYVLTGSKAFQYLTPFGGLALIGGWAALAAHHAGVLPDLHGAASVAAAEQAAEQAAAAAAAEQAAKPAHAAYAFWRRGA